MKCVRDMIRTYDRLHMFLSIDFILLLSFEFKAILQFFPVKAL